MVRTFQLSKGHARFDRLKLAKAKGHLYTIVAKHTSAAGLTSQDVPTLLQHKLLTPSDKKIWDAAYDEEFDGLQDLPAWTVITEKQMKQLRNKNTSVLPTMTISTIKYKDGIADRAKYRIVALGNLDPHDWKKSDVYAPVLSLLELRFLTALAVKHKIVLKMEI